MAGIGVAIVYWTTIRPAGLPAGCADSARGTPARWQTRAGDPAAGKARAAHVLRSRRE